jgi:hypothetical protein
LVYTGEDKAQTKGFLNLGAKTINAVNLKIFTLVNAKNLIFTPKALEILESKVK